MTKKNTITRAQALEFAIDNIAANCRDDMENTGANEVIAILEKMHASITKPRAKSDAPSKTRIENLRLLENAINAMVKHGEPVNTKWLTEHVQFISTSQKAAAIMRLGVELGKVIKTTEGRKVSYRVA